MQVVRVEFFSLLGVGWGISLVKWCRGLQNFSILCVSEVDSRRNGWNWVEIGETVDKVVKMGDLGHRDFKVMWWFQ